MRRFSFGKSRKINYHQKKYENPFFRKKRSYFSFSMSNKTINKFFLILGLLVFILLIWFLFFSHFFIVNKISINGLTRINHDEMESLVMEQTRESRFFIGSQRNIFLFKTNELVDKITKKYAFADLSVKKKMFHEIIVDVQEKPLAFIWVEAQRYFYVDADGYIIKEVSPLDIKDKNNPIIENGFEQGKVDINKINIDLNLTNYIILLDEKFKQNLDYQIEIEKFILNEEPRTVRLKVLGGPELYFNSEEGIDNQIEKLLLLKADKLKDVFMEKHYIDLRFGDRVYYR